MAEKKITKREVLNHMLETYSNDEMVVAYATHEIELLDKKNLNTAPSKTQIENENLRKVIVEVLTNSEKKMTIVDIQAQDERLGQASNQKMSALLKPLVDNGTIKKEIVKKKIYFYI